ncbi:MAG: hypothetical protein QXK37_05395, partial [Candidatus Woesearchaeota archaeon]
MTHPALHFIIPVLILIIFKFDKLLVLLISPLSLLPDIDYFFPPHRAVTHNIFFGMLIIFLAFFI